MSINMSAAADRSWFHTCASSAENERNLICERKKESCAYRLRCLRCRAACKLGRCSWYSFSSDTTHSQQTARLQVSRDERQGNVVRGASHAASVQNVRVAFKTMGL